jgi:hypothetical protein
MQPNCSKEGQHWAFFKGLTLPADLCATIYAFTILNQDKDLSRAIFFSICTEFLRIKGLQKASTDPWVSLRFLRTLLHQDLGTSLRKKSLSSGENKI